MKHCHGDRMEQCDVKRGVSQGLKDKNRRKNMNVRSTGVRKTSREALYLEEYQMSNRKKCTELFGGTRVHGG